MCNDLEIPLEKIIKIKNFQLKGTTWAVHKTWLFEANSWWCPHIAAPTFGLQMVKAHGSYWGGGRASPTASFMNRLRLTCPAFSNLQAVASSFLALSLRDHFCPQLSFSGGWGVNFVPPLVVSQDFFVGGGVVPDWELNPCCGVESVEA